MLEKVLNDYGFDPAKAKIDLVGTGLINHTWKVQYNETAYILQQINTTAFRYPDRIARNISLIADYLQKHAGNYMFIAPIDTLSGENMAVREGKYFRLFPFVEGSHTIDVVETPEQAYEAAAEFARFTKLLSGFDVSQLQETSPGFHDLGNRYQQFIHALSYGNPERLKESEETIKEASAHAAIVNQYLKVKDDPAFKLRVTHHDTKISNVLFDDGHKAMCVIDLDTVMPGYFISDVGDMMRTYLCPVSEEEKDFSKIEIRDEFYHAIVNGYSSEMSSELSAEEKKQFLYSGQFMIYMQALRFLTDHLNNDVYYGAKYEGHNLVRAQNQLVLLRKLSEKSSLSS